MRTRTGKKILSVVLTTVFIAVNTVYSAPESRSLFKNKKVDYDRLSAERGGRLQEKKTIFQGEGAAREAERDREAKRVLQAHLKDISQIHIPSELGRVIEVYDAMEKSEPGTENKLIVHIQDLHTNPEAELNLAAILEILLKDYKMGLVCSEGAEGEVDTSAISSFPNYTAKEKVSRIFINSGELTGEEYLSITKYPDLPIWGIEDRNIYFDNIIQYNKIMKFSPASMTFISQAKKALDELKLKIYSKELLSIDQKETEYENQKIETDAYLKDLAGYIQKFNIPTDNYRNISILRQALDYEPRIDQPKVMQDSQNLLINLQASFLKAGRKSEIDSLMAKARLFNEQKLSSFSFYSYLKDLAVEHNVIASAEGAKQSQQYPHLIEFVDYLTQVNSLDNTKLFVEMEALVYEIKQRLAQTAEQKTFITALRNIKFLEGFFNLKVSNEELDYYLNNRDAHKTAFFESFLKPALKKYGVSSFVDFNPLLIDSRLQELEDFYKVVKERDIAMLKNSLSEIEKRDVNVAALIAGGFHTKGITRMLREKGYSYIVVSPYSSTDIDEENYRYLLSGRRRPITELMNQLDLPEIVNRLTSVGLRITLGLNDTLVEAFNKTKAAELAKISGLPEYKTKLENILVRMAPLFSLQKDADIWTACPYGIEIKHPGGKKVVVECKIDTEGDGRYKYIELTSQLTNLVVPSKFTGRTVASITRRVKTDELKLASGEGNIPGRVELKKGPYDQNWWEQATMEQLAKNPTPWGEDKIVPVEEKKGLLKVTLTAKMFENWSQDNPEGRDLGTSSNKYDEIGPLAIAGIRHVMNINNVHDTRQVKNSVERLLTSASLGLMVKIKYNKGAEFPYQSNYGHEVRYHSNIFQKITTRVLAAMGFINNVVPGDVPTAIWNTSTMGKFFNFPLSFCGTSSHSPSSMDGLKIMDYEGSQFLISDIEALIAIKKAIVAHIKEKGSFTFTLSAENDPRITDQLYKSTHNGMYVYKKYQERTAADNLILDLIKKLDPSKVHIDCMDGSGYRTLKAFFKEMGLESITDKIDWMHTEERSDFDNIGKLLEDPKTGKDKVFDLGADGTQMFERVMPDGKVVKYFPVLCTADYPERLAKMPIGDVILPTDMDNDRLYYIQIMRNDNDTRKLLDEIGVVYNVINEEKIAAVHIPNKSFHLLQDMNLERIVSLMREDKISKKRKIIILKTLASTPAVDQWAEKKAEELAKEGIGLEVINTAVGFAKLANVMYRTEGVMTEKPGEDVIITDATGKDINIGSDPIILAAWEESGGIITGIVYEFKDLLGKYFLAEREKSATESIFLSLALISKLQQERGEVDFAKYLKEIYDKYDITTPIDFRYDNSLYVPAATKESALEEQAGNERKNRIFGAYLSIAIAKMRNQIEMKEVRTILKDIFKQEHETRKAQSQLPPVLIERFNQIDFDFLKDVWFTGDGVMCVFEKEGKQWFVLFRPSGTEPKLKSYGFGKDIERLTIDSWSFAFNENVAGLLPESFRNNDILMDLWGTDGLKAVDKGRRMQSAWEDFGLVIDPQDLTDSQSKDLEKRRLVRKFSPPDNHQELINNWLREQGLPEIVIDSAPQAMPQRDIVELLEAVPSSVYEKLGNRKEDVLNKEREPVKLASGNNIEEALELLQLSDKELVQVSRDELVSMPVEFREPSFAGPIIRQGIMHKIRGFLGGDVKALMSMTDIPIIMDKTRAGNHPEMTALDRLNKRTIPDIQSVLDRREEINLALDTAAGSDTITNVIILGMGGSGIAPEVAEGFSSDIYDGESPLKTTIVKGDKIPDGIKITDQTLVIAATYSGTTGETLDALQDAINKGAVHILGISTNGEKLRGVADDRLSFIQIPRGEKVQPREAYTFTVAMMLSIKGDLLERIKHTEFNGQVNLEGGMADIKGFFETHPESDPLSEEILKRCLSEDKGLLIIHEKGDPILKAAAERAAQQVSECHKVIAEHVEDSELITAGSLRGNWIPVIFRRSDASTTTEQNLEDLKPIVIDKQSDNKFADLFIRETIWTRGAAYNPAIYKGRDQIPVFVIEKFKSIMANPGLVRSIKAKLVLSENKDLLPRDASYDEILAYIGESTPIIITTGDAREKAAVLQEKLLKEEGIFAPLWVSPEYEHNRINGLAPFMHGKNVKVVMLETGTETGFADAQDDVVKVQFLKPFKPLVVKSDSLKLASMSNLDAAALEIVVKKLAEIAKTRAIYIEDDNITTNTSGSEAIEGWRMDSEISFFSSPRPLRDALNMVSEAITEACNRTNWWLIIQKGSSENDIRQQLGQLVKPLTSMNNVKIDLKLFGGDEEKMEHVFVFIGSEVLENPFKAADLRGKLLQNYRVAIIAADEKERDDLINRGFTDDNVDILIAGKDELDGFNIRNIKNDIDTAKAMHGSIQEILSQYNIMAIEDFTATRLDLLNKVNPRLAKQVLQGV